MRISGLVFTHLLNCVYLSWKMALISPFMAVTSPTDISFYIIIKALPLISLGERLCSMLHKKGLSTCIKPSSLFSTTLEFHFCIFRKSIFSCILLHFIQLSIVQYSFELYENLWKFNASAKWRLTEWHRFIPSWIRCTISIFYKFFIGWSHKM